MYLMCSPTTGFTARSTTSTFFIATAHPRKDLFLFTIHGIHCWMKREMLIRKSSEEQRSSLVITHGWNMMANPSTNSLCGLTQDSFMCSTFHSLREIKRLPLLPGIVSY